jgi:hypothetical protein
MYHSSMRVAAPLPAIGVQQSARAADYWRSAAQISKPIVTGGAHTHGGGPSLQRAFVASRGLDLRLDVEGDLPDLWGDRDLLLQVLGNLIHNASKSTAPGGRITVEARRGEPDAVFFVTDTGAGIPRGRPPAPVRPFLAGAEGRAARCRTRPRDRQGYRRGSRRAHLGRERAGRRQHVLLHGARCAVGGGSV